ncbi:MAG: hypothetical protein ACTSYC_04280 [Promethearchaeota archaeon]
MSFNSVEECLKEIENRYNSSEKIKNKLKDYVEPIQMTFLDTGRKALLLINKNQGIETKIGEGDENAPVKIDFTSEEVMIDMFNKKIGGVKAYSSGKIKIVQGKARNLMKLRSLMF